MPRYRKRSVSYLPVLGFPSFLTNTFIVESVSIQVKNKCYKHSKACQLLYKAMAQLEQVKWELTFIESNSTQLVYYKQEILASIKHTKRSSIINYGAIINVFRGLSFNFSSIDLSLEGWSLLLSILVGNPKVAIYSKLNYSQAPKYSYYLYTLFTL